MAEQTATQTPPTGAPSMTLGGEMLEFSTFLGIIITDAWELSERGNWRWHLAVRPVDIPIGGDTGAFHSWTNFSEQKNSAMGAQREAMKNIFPSDLKIGAGDLIGQVAHWTRKDITFGTNKQTGEEMVAKQILMPLRPASAEETQRAQSQGNGPSGPAVAVEAAADAQELDAETTQKVLELVHGKTKPALQIAVTRAKELSKEVKQGILSGQLIDALIAEGLVITDGTTYHVPSLEGE